MKTISREGKTKSLLLDVRRITAYLMCVALCVMFITSSLGGVLSSTTESTSEMTTGLADSPWPKYGGNNKNTGQSPHDTSHVDGTELWRFRTDDSIRSSPVIGVDGTIYVGSNDGNMYAINPNGTEKWRFETDDSIRSSPVIGVDGTIYVGSMDYHVYAINTDGTEKWRFDIGGDVSSPPAIGADGTIYIGSLDGRVHAINPDGTEKWNFTTGWSVHSSPAIDDYGTIYVGSEGRIFAINPNGTEKWRYGDQNKVLYSTPAIGSDGTIYTVEVDGLWSSSFLAIEADGTVKWQRFNIHGWIISSPAISEDGTIFFGVNYRLFAVNPDGMEKWNISTYGGKRISIGGDGTIYARSPSADRPEGLGAIHPDGSEIWNFSTEEDAGHYDIGSSAVIGEDGTIYFGSLDGNVYAIGEGHHLTINEPLGNGTIELDGEEITEWPCEEKHGAGKTIDLTAVPNEGWYFSHWTGDVPEGEEYSEDITVFMDDNKTLTAHFERREFSLNLSVEGEGTTTPTIGDHTYLYEDEVNVTAVANEGWYFSHWTGDVADDEVHNENITIFMDDNKTLTAHFDEIIPPTVNITSFDDGTVFDNDEVTVEWEAVEGTYSIDRYEVRLNDGEWIDVGTDTRYTFEGLDDGEYTVTVRAVDTEGNHCVESANFTVDTEWGQLWILPVIGIVVVLLALVLYLTKDRWLETRLTEGEVERDVEEEDHAVLEDMGEESDEM